MKSPRPPCSVPNCFRPVLARNICTGHYRRKYTVRLPDGVWNKELLRRANKGTYEERTCAQPGCNRRPHANYLCKMHYKRTRTGQDLDEPVIERFGSNGAHLRGITVDSGIVFEMARLAKARGMTVGQVHREALAFWLKQRRINSPVREQAVRADAWSRRDEDTVVLGGE